MMTQEEVHQAVAALIDWFEAQDISMFDAIAVVGALLINIHAIAGEPEEVS